MRKNRQLRRKPPSKPNGPRDLKAGGFTDGRWRLDERESAAHASILKYFTVETAPRQPDKWLVECPHCGDMWHLAKDSTHPGNILSLLNHARGHDAKN